MNERSARSPEVIDDATLVERLRADAPRWISVVVDRYERPLLRHARAVTGDADAAQDVVQEGFLRLLSNGCAIENLPGWLFRVTHNLALDHLRTRSRRKRLHDAAAALALPQSAEQDGDWSENWTLVEAELARLSPNERACLYLKVKEGKSYKEISQITGLSTSNVGYLIHHGVRQIAARLGRRRGPSKGAAE